MRRLACIITLWLAASQAFAVGVDNDVLDDPAKEAKAQRIMADLRCLVCQNQSIVDSNAPLAADLRQIVRERVALGEDGSAVKAYLVQRYGDWVLLNPPLNKSTILLWGAPIAVLLFGCFIVFVMRSRGVAVLSSEDAQRADDLMRDGLE